MMRKEQFKEDDARSTAQAWKTGEGCDLPIDLFESW
jgi:hypothetical protein